MRLNTFVAYLTFLFQGITFALGNVMIMEIADTFAVDTSVIGYILSLGFVGGSLATIASGFLLTKWQIKKLFIAGSGITLLGALGLTITNQLILFAVGYLLFGFGAWLFITLGNYMIVQMYEREKRSSELNIANFFASFGALLTPIGAGFLLHQQVNWKLVFWCPLILLLLFQFLISRPHFGIHSPKNNLSSRGISGVAHKINIGLAAAALFFYCLVEVGYVSWIIVHLRENLAVGIMDASLVLTVFYISCAVGRLLSGMIVNYVSLEKYIIVCAALGAIMSTFVLLSHSYIGIISLTAGFAFSISSLYPCILSYGTLQMKPSSPSLVNLVILTGIIGASAGVAVTSFLKQQFGVLFSLGVCAVASACIIICIGMNIWITRPEKG